MRDWQGPLVGAECPPLQSPHAPALRSAAAVAVEEKVVETRAHSRNQSMRHMAEVPTATAVAVAAATTEQLVVVMVELRGLQVVEVR